MQKQEEKAHIFSTSKFCFILLCFSANIHLFLFRFKIKYIYSCLFLIK